MINLSLILSDGVTYLALQLHSQGLGYFAASCEQRVSDASLVQDLPDNLAVAVYEVHILFRHAAVV